MKVSELVDLLNKLSKDSEISLKFGNIDIDIADIEQSVKTDTATIRFKCKGVKEEVAPTYKYKNGHCILDIPSIKWYF